MTKSLEVLAILTYHPIVREHIINDDVQQFVILLKKEILNENYKSANCKHMVKCIPPLVRVLK